MSEEVNELKYNELKKQYLDLYKESEDLYKENIHIYYEYNFTFGKTFHKRYNLYYLCERTTKKLEIFTDKILAKATINLDQIDKDLNLEFKDLQRKVALIQNEYEQAVIFKNIPEMHPEDAKELIEVFIDITNYIHPDLRDHDDIIKKLWKKSLSAYRNNDIKALRDCKQEITKLGLELPTKSTKKIDYEKKIRSFKENIEILTSKNTYLINSFPYNQKGILNSKELINDKLKDVEKDCLLFARRLENLENIIAEFLDHNQKFIC